MKEKKYPQTRNKGKVEVVSQIQKRVQTEK